MQSSNHLLVSSYVVLIVSRRALSSFICNGQIGRISPHFMST
jgi:hypothetical protein